MSNYSFESDICRSTLAFHLRWVLNTLAKGSFKENVRRLATVELHTWGCGYWAELVTWLGAAWSAKSRMLVDMPQYSVMSSRCIQSIPSQCGMMLAKWSKCLEVAINFPFFFLFWRSLNLGWTPRNSNVREGQSCDGGDLISTTEVMRGCVCMESALWHVFAVLFLISFLFYFVIELYLSVFRCWLVAYMCT